MRFAILLSRPLKTNGQPLYYIWSEWALYYARYELTLQFLLQVVSL